MHNHPHADPPAVGAEAVAPHDADDHHDCPDCNAPAPFVRAQAKVGRNEACPCGSGTKYKRCCGR